MGLRPRLLLLVFLAGCFLFSCTPRQQADPAPKPEDAQQRPVEGQSQEPGAENPPAPGQPQQPAPVVPTVLQARWFPGAFDLADVWTSASVPPTRYWFGPLALPWTLGKESADVLERADAVCRHLVEDPAAWEYEAAEGAGTQVRGFWESLHRKGLVPRTWQFGAPRLIAGEEAEVPVLFLRADARASGSLLFRYEDDNWFLVLVRINEGDLAASFRKPQEAGFDPDDQQLRRDW